MSSSAINALNAFAKDKIREFIGLLVADGLIREDTAQTKFSEMDFGTTATKRRADVVIPGSPSGYTDAYLESASGAVLRNIGQLNGITGIKQSGRQNKAEMVAVIKTHFAQTVTEVDEALPVLEPADSLTVTMA